MGFLRTDFISRTFGPVTKRKLWRLLKVDDMFQSRASIGDHGKGTQTSLKRELKYSKLFLISIILFLAFLFVRGSLLNGISAVFNHHHSDASAHNTDVRPSPKVSLTKYDDIRALWRRQGIKGAISSLLDEGQGDSPMTLVRRNRGIKWQHHKNSIFRSVSVRGRDETVKLRSPGSGTMRSMDSTSVRQEVGSYSDQFETKDHSSTSESGSHISSSSSRINYTSSLHDDLSEHHNSSSLSGSNSTQVRGNDMRNVTSRVDIPSSHKSRLTRSVSEDRAVLYRRRSLARLRNPERRSRRTHRLRQFRHDDESLSVGGSHLSRQVASGRIVGYSKGRSNRLRRSSDGDETPSLVSGASRRSRRRNGSIPSETSRRGSSFKRVSEPTKSRSSTRLRRHSNLIRSGFDDNLSSIMSGRTSTRSTNRRRNHVLHQSRDVNMPSRLRSSRRSTHHLVTSGRTKQERTKTMRDKSSRIHVSHRSARLATSGRIKQPELVGTRTARDNSRGAHSLRHSAHLVASGHIKQPEQVRMTTMGDKSSKVHSSHQSAHFATSGSTKQPGQMGAKSTRDESRDAELMLVSDED